MSLILLPFIFQGPPSEFGEGFVEAVALALHRDPTAYPFQAKDVIWAALICVYDLGQLDEIYRLELTGKYYRDTFVHAKKAQTPE